MNIEFSDMEVEYLKQHLQDYTESWEDGMQEEGDRRAATMELTILNKLKGMTPEAAELEARRQVDAWWDEQRAPGGP